MPQPGAPRPFAAATPTLEALRTGRSQGVYRELDATLGHDGLPQSATGQTTLLTGLNAADAMAGHYGPWPGPTLRRLLDEGSLFHDASRAGGARLANAYPPGYFAARQGRRFRPNAVAYAALAAGVPQLGREEHARGEAVPSDLEGAHLEGTSGPRGPRATAEALAALAARHALTVLDVWLLDAYGHAQDGTRAAELMGRLDAAVSALLTGPAAAAGVTVVLTSDHGNAEDLSVPTHTRNPVPLYAFGPGADAFKSAASLLDFAPAVRALLRS